MIYVHYMKLFVLFKFSVDLEKCCLLGLSLSGRDILKPPTMRVYLLLSPYNPCGVLFLYWEALWLVPVTIKQNSSLFLIRFTVLKPIQYEDCHAVCPDPRYIPCLLFPALAHRLHQPSSLASCLWLGRQWEAGVERMEKRSSISCSTLLHLSYIIWWKPCSSMADGDLSSWFQHTLRSDKTYCSCHFQLESSNSFCLFFLPIYFLNPTSLLRLSLSHLI